MNDDVWNREKKKDNCSRKDGGNINEWQKFPNDRNECGERKSSRSYSTVVIQFFKSTEESKLTTSAIVSLLFDQYLMMILMIGSSNWRWKTSLDIDSSESTLVHT